MAAGFGVAAMLGLVGVMGLAKRPGADAAPVAAVPAPAQVLVVIRHDGVSTPVASGQPVVIPAVVQGAAAPVASSGPIALTARPVVRQVAAAAAPRARTNGSR